MGNATHGDCRWYTYPASSRVGNSEILEFDDNMGDCCCSGSEFSVGSDGED